MATLDEYIQLMGLFATGSIKATAFERQYFEIFKNDDNRKPERVFLVLDKLFADLDSFCCEPELRDADDIDEEELRRRCQLALAKLKT